MGEALLRLLVTGGSGKIGSRLIAALEESNHETMNFDLRSREGSKKEGHFIRGDLVDREKLDDAMKGIDTVIHLAAFPMEEVIPNYYTGWDVNCTGTFNVFEAAVRNDVRKVIFASSICAVGFITWNSSRHSIKYFPVDEAHPCRPESIYGASKLLAETLAHMYARRTNTSFVGFRIATVWFDGPEGGPDDDTKNLISDFVLDPGNILDRSFPYPNVTVHALKDLAWQYIGVRDVLEAMNLAVGKKMEGFEVYNISAADTCSDWDSLKIAQHFYPDVPILGPEAFQRDKKKTLFNFSKAEKELGFKPRFSWKEFISESSRQHRTRGLPSP